MDSERSVVFDGVAAFFTVFVSLNSFGEIGGGNSGKRIEFFGDDFFIEWDELSTACHVNIVHLSVLICLWARYFFPYFL